MNILPINCKANLSWTHLSLIEDGELCGVIDLCPPKSELDPGVFICSLFVVESKRRHGYARALFREAIRLAAASGFRAAWLRVASDNEAAINLYKSEGFFPMSYDVAAAEQTWVMDLAVKG
jgi:ribosomal protein S18 acetylase RimI-like enzyme